LIHGSNIVGEIKNLFHVSVSHVFFHVFLMTSLMLNALINYNK
jgi:hypothetical protein